MISTPLRWHRHTRKSLKILQISYQERRFKSSNVAFKLPAALSTDLAETVRSNLNWVNQNYENFFGISEIRAIQSRVLEAEAEFVASADRRKWCYEQIQHLKDSIKSLRDKIDATERSSDNYLFLITSEHKLIKDEAMLAAQLEGLKEREQAALDNLSRLLRQSHELERIRQERSKYGQIISLALSVVASLIALMHQRSKTQTTTMKRLDKMNENFAKLGEMNEKLREETGVIRLKLSDLSIALAKLQRDQRQDKAHNSWSSYVPGLVTVGSWFGYKL